MTPQMFAHGIYEVKSPYALPADVSFTCIAIRSFQDVRNEGGNVFELYYKPAGVEQSIYDTDDKNAVSIISLYAQGRVILHIPDSFITRVPVGDANGYSRLVIGAEVGIVPNTIDLSVLTQEIKNLISDYTGLTDSTVEIYTAPFTGNLTPQQAASFERNREAAMGGRVSTYARATAAESKVAELMEINKRLADIIIANGISPP